MNIGEMIEKLGDSFRGLWRSQIKSTGKVDILVNNRIKKLLEDLNA